MKTLAKTILSPVLSLVAGSLFLGLLAIGSQALALTFSAVAVATIVKFK